MRDSIDVVLVSDDHSTDRTYEAALEYQRTHDALPLAVVRQRRNLGYGGNQKFGYRWLAEHGCDIAVLLHGDGQYAPEVLPEMVAPLLEGRADVVLGSRMLVPGGALERRDAAVQVRRQQDPDPVPEPGLGARPLGVALGLPRLPPRRAREDPVRGEQRRLRLRHRDHAAAARLRRADRRGADPDLLRRRDLPRERSCLRAETSAVDVVRYRLARLGFGASHLARWSSAYGWKDAPDASHRVVLAAADELRLRPGACSTSAAPAGCSAPSCARAAIVVVGVDGDPPPGAEDNVDRLVVADLDAGLPAEAAEDGPFDVVLAVDVLEHLRDPARLLRELHEVTLGRRRCSISSVPNIGHWYPRLRIGFGRFDYDRRGILDATHLRFFTWRSFAAMAARVGWRVEQRRLTGLPLEVLGFDRRRPAARGFAGRSRASTVPDARSGRRSSPTSTSPCCAPTRRSPRSERHATRTAPLAASNPRTPLIETVRQPAH